MTKPEKAAAPAVEEALREKVEQITFDLELTQQRLTDALAAIGYTKSYMTALKLALNGMGFHRPEDMITHVNALYQIALEAETWLSARQEQLSNQDSAETVH